MFFGFLFGGGWQRRRCCGDNHFPEAFITVIECPSGISARILAAISYVFITAVTGYVFPLLFFRGGWRDLFAVVTVLLPVRPRVTRGALPALIITVIIIKFSVFIPLPRILFGGGWRGVNLLVFWRELRMRLAVGRHPSNPSILLRRGCLYVGVLLL